MRDMLDWMAFQNWIGERMDDLADWWRGLELGAAVLVAIGAATALLFFLVAVVSCQG